MKYQSASWFSMINAPRNKLGPALECVYPTITQPLAPELLALFNNAGTGRWFEAGESIIRYGDQVDSVMVVLSGVTARQVGQGEGNAIAIAIPGRFACGNLNFFTSHPCIGSYFALTRCRIAVIAREFLFRLIADNQLLWRLMCRQTELCNLSDRLTFAVLTQLPAADRLKSFFLAWAIWYAKWVDSGDEKGGWLKMPATIQRRYLVYAAHVSRCTLDAVLKEWTERHLLMRKGAEIFIRPALLDDCYEWICRMEEPSQNRRPRTFLDNFRCQKK